MVVTESGWWFGTCLIFPEILGISSSQLTNSYVAEELKPPTRNVKHEIWSTIILRQREKMGEVEDFNWLWVSNIICEYVVVRPNYLGWFSKLTQKYWGCVETTNQFVIKLEDSLARRAKRKWGPEQAELISLGRNVNPKNQKPFPVWHNDFLEMVGHSKFKPQIQLRKHWVYQIEIAQNCHIASLGFSHRGATAKLEVAASRGVFVRTQCQNARRQPESSDGNDLFGIWGHE